MLDDFDLLLEQARAGSPEAFTAIYRDLGRPVASYLRGQGVRDVEDVTSDVFVAVLTGLDGFVGTQAQFRSWVFTIAHRRVVDGWRRAGRRPDHVPYEVDDDTRTAASAEEGALDVLGDGRVVDLLRHVTDEQREVLVLRIVADLTVEQVAEVLDKRPGAVKALQRRGLATLKGLLEREGVPL